MAEKKPTPVQRFAHLIGLGVTASSPAAAKAEGDDDDRKKRDDESDEEHAARLKALDEEDDDGGEKNGKKAKKAEGEDPEGEEGDDDSDMEETKKGSKARSARIRERNRCAAIFASPEAAANPALAAELAFGPENMSRSAAIRIMKTTANYAAPAKRASLDERMRTISVPNPGASAAVSVPAANSAAATAAAIVAAGKKRRGEA